MASSVSWTEKYRPKKVSDIVCNSKGVQQICGWLRTFEKVQVEKHKSLENKRRGKKDDLKIPKTVKSCLLITGNHGVGKTLAVQTVFKEYGYTIQNVEFSKLKIGKDVQGGIKKLIQSANVTNMMSGKRDGKIAILIDEIESVTSSTDKATILALQKINDANWYCPIIFISNNQHNKLLSETKKGSVEVRFWSPYNQDMYKILAQIAPHEKIRIKNQSVVDMILNHAQSDIRRLINTLQDIKYAYPNQVITAEIINEYCNMSKKKDTDIDLYHATNGLLYEYSSIDDCIRYYETEKVLLPLMVHQNYCRSVLANTNDQDKRFDTVNQVADALSTGDVIENYIYGDQNWEMQEVHGFFTCVVTSYLLNESKKNQTRTDLEFTTDLNKTSIKKINKKNIVNTNKCFKDMNIFDFIYINKIIRTLIERGDIEQCVVLLQRYDIKLEHIESLLKIDKIKNTKTSLSSKQKKEFAKYLEEHANETQHPADPVSISYETIAKNLATSKSSDLSEILSSALDIDV